MIFVTLGTIPFEFKRAIAWLDCLLQQQIIQEPVLLQHGITDVSALLEYQQVTTVPLLESKQFIELVDAARLVISHAGQGSTRMLAARSARFILLPRLQRYGEHIDDHQLWFSQGIDCLGVASCLSLAELEKFIQQPPPPFPHKLFNGPKLADHLLQVYPA
jgi:UDP-N-acetylglucosamine transferase subunit ALG13